MLIFTIPPAMRQHASIRLTTCLYQLEVGSCLDTLDVELNVYSLSEYINKTFTRSVDAVLTSRLLNIEPQDVIYADTVVDRNDIKFNWESLKEFFSEIVADPESKLDMVLMQAYDESYDALIDADDWLTLLEKFLYSFAEDALKDLDDLFKLVDESMPNLIQYVEQQKIEYASMSHGLIIFN